MSRNFGTGQNYYYVRPTIFTIHVWVAKEAEGGGCPEKISKKQKRDDWNLKKYIFELLYGEKYYLTIYEKDVFKNKFMKEKQEEERNRWISLHGRLFEVQVK